jgi:hypothetical protein
MISKSIKFCFLYNIFFKIQIITIMSNSNPKAHLAWNTIDPDDPYDIRKSMIAQLPGSPPKSMSGHI